METPADQIRERIAPLRPPYSDEDAQALTRWMPPGAPAEPLALFRTFLRNPALAEAMLPLGSFFLSRRSGLPLRVRELVIQRVCARTGCAYEWGVHAAAFAAAARFDDATLAATVLAPPDAPVWNDEDRPIIAMVDSLHETGAVPDSLWTTLASRFSEEQLLALLVLAGWYHVIAYVARGAQVEHEPWATPWPAGG